MRTDARTKHRPFIHGLVLIAVSLVVSYATLTGTALHSKTPAFAAPVTGLSMPGVSASVPPADQNVLRATAINKTLRVETQPSVRQRDTAAAIAAASATPTSAPQLVAVAGQGDDPLLRASSVPTPESLPPYKVYTVGEGDTVGSIAARFGVKSEYVLANNAEIRDSDFLKLGQSIIVPTSDGVLHEVRYGETLSDIAARYGVPVEDITRFAANNIATADDITEQQVVFVPNGKPIPAAPVATEVVATPTGAAGSSTSVVDDTPEPTATPAARGSGSGGGSSSGRSAGSSSSLIWPVSGPISSYYGSSHPLGIDIDGFNLPGASVGAATSGTVIFAGGNACCSYGLYVVVLSASGIETLYAHLSSISVSQGTTVSQGEELGVIGNTGYSTGRHLHLEVIDNGVRQNPLTYLP